jgi:hypothetical protein
MTVGVRGEAVENLFVQIRPRLIKIQAVLKFCSRGMMNFKNAFQQVLVGFQFIAFERVFGKILSGKLFCHNDILHNPAHGIRRNNIVWNISPVTAGSKKNDKKKNGRALH